MMFFKRIKIRSYEMGLYFRNGEFKGLRDTGTNWLFDPLWRVRVEVVSQRDPWLVHDKLDMIVKSGALTDLAEVVDLKDHERALVWIDGRFSHVLAPGLYTYWTGQREVKVELVDAPGLRDRARGDFCGICRQTTTVTTCARRWGTPPVIVVLAPYRPAGPCRAKQIPKSRRVSLAAHVRRRFGAKSRTAF